jgi:phytoene desaturase
MARVVVIGAGLGGLAAAARLARLGHEVTVCEAAAEIGGKLGVLSRDGFTFDTGPSLLTLPAVYRDLFLKTGAPLEKVLSITPVEPVAHYRFPGGLELDMPNGIPRAAAAWANALGPQAGSDWQAFMDRAARIWDLTRGPFLESPLEGARTLLRLSRDLGAVRTIAPWKSLRGLGHQYLHSAEQRMFLDRYATYTGSDPRRAPAALATVPYVEQAFGAWYVPGGLRLLGEAVADRAREVGAKILLNSRVSAISHTGTRVDGVRLVTGEHLPADVVVANADAAQVYGELLPGDVATRPRNALRKATPSLGGFVLLLALRGRTPGLRHHTVLFPDRYDDEFDAIFGREPRPVDDPTVYISAPDDPALRPDDEHEAWFVLVNAPPQGAGTDWTAPGAADRYADRVLAVMAARGLDVRDRVLWREIRTPADLERATGTPGGSIYGTSSNGARAAFLRPANRSPVGGLFLVGGSSHPGGGLPLVGLSAAIVSELIGPA